MSMLSPRRSAHPHALDQVILADDPVTVTHQIDKKVEHLRFERHRFGPATQFAPLDIEHMIAKPENHLRSLGSAQMSFLRRRQAHVKDKSSASQSLPLRVRASSQTSKGGSAVEAGRLRRLMRICAAAISSKGVRPWLSKPALTP